MLEAFVRRLVLPVNAKAEIVRPRKQDGRCPSVSVVIPCYNYGRYLTQCVNSALDQQGVRVDVLIIDDASSDGSDQIAFRLSAQDPRIRTIRHTANRGHTATFNEGITQTTGDYTVLLSADDLLTPGSLARATSLMEEYPSVGLTYGSTIIFTDDDLPTARTIARRWIIWHGHDWLMQTCKNGENAVGAGGLVMRRTVLREIGVFKADLPHAGDFEMWMRVATVSDIGYVDGADQSYYRHHANNMHHAYSALDDYSQRLASFDAIFSERSELLKDADSMRDTAHRVIARIALSHAIRDTAHRAIARNLFSRAIAAYSRVVVGDETIDDYTAFALKAWPNAKQLREWRTLDKLFKVRDSPPGLDPSLITRMAMRKLRTRFVLWRRRWAGM
jgi:glycosyltransferase involved in cell wall biosynthesis